MTAQEIAQRLYEAKEAYYNSGNPLMTDGEFDALEEKLRDLNPEDPYFSTVGTGGSIETENPGSGKILHVEAMLSMGKAKTPAEVFKWMDKLKMPEETLWTLQPKIDGLSAACFYARGHLQYVATRGDGKTGQDITSIAPYIQDIPEKIDVDRDLEVRGELYLPRDTAYDTGGRPLRNNCAGLINRKENREDLRHVRFVAYQSSRWKPCPGEGAVITWLKDKGFHTVEHFSISSREELALYYQDYLDRLRDSWLYETDGLIIMVDDNRLHGEIDSRWVVDHHHHYALALKPPAASRKTKLKDVEWQVSRQGNLIPVALFEAVSLGGAVLSRASLHNLDFVKSMALQIGDELLIERANDVIPYVRENLCASGREGELFLSTLIPSCCPVCRGEVEEEGVHLKCKNPGCPERTIQTILYWVQESGMEQIAEATIRLLHEQGFLRKISDLYRITRENLEGLEGFGEKKTANFLTQIEKARFLSAPELISRLGIPLVQQKALKKLGIKTMDDFWEFEDGSYVTGQNILEWKSSSDNRELLKDLLSVLNLQNTSEKKSLGQVCMTGKGPSGRKELQRIIEARGYEFSSSLTKSTNILLCEDPEGNSSKLQKARKLGTRLMAYEEFLNLPAT